MKITGKGKMMVARVSGGPVALALALALAGPAQALTLECSIPQSSAGGGYITKTYVFQYEEGDVQAIVSDGLIQYTFDAPIEARVTDATARKLVFSWDVQMTNSTGQQTKMMFRATYFRESARMTVRATPGGYANSFEGRGSCRQV